MSLNIIHNPEVFSGFIEEFGFHKIERQTKIVIKNILSLFFASQTQLFKSTMPEIIEVQNSREVTKIFIEKDFPFFERKLPLIAITSKNKVEKKPYIGSDDFLYQDTYINTSSGIYYNLNYYANMFDVPVTLIIATLSPEARMQLQELVQVCFSHYFRWQYMYEGEDGSRFHIVPSGGPLSIAGEQEVKDKSNTTLVYITSVSFVSSVEYIFGEPADNADLVYVTGMDLKTYTPTEPEEIGSQETSVDPSSEDFRWWIEQF